MKAINPEKTYRLGEVWKNEWLPVKAYSTCIRYFDKGMFSTRKLQVGIKKIRYLSGQEVLDFVKGGIPLEVCEKETNINKCEEKSVENV